MALSATEHFPSLIPGLEDKMVKKIANTELMCKRPKERHSWGFICRLDFKDAQRIKECLAPKGCSFSGLVRDILKRGLFAEDETQTINTPKSNGGNPAKGENNMVFEKMHQTAPNQDFDFRLCPLYCPKCDEQEMSESVSEEINSEVAKSLLIVWWCPKCGYSFDTRWSFDKPQGLRLRSINEKGK
jgi:hypothetical protein